MRIAGHPLRILVVTPFEVTILVYLLRLDYDGRCSGQEPRWQQKLHNRGWNVVLPLAHHSASVHKLRFIWNRS
jgi:hypothetical protein